MNKLDEMISELCPDGVDFKPLWEMTYWDKKFQDVDKSWQPQIIDYKVLLANDLFALKQDAGNVFLLSTGSETGWTTEELAGDALREGEVVAIPWGKAGTVNVKNVIKYYKGKFVTGDNRIMTSRDREVLDNRFLYHYIVSEQGIDNSFYRGAGIRHPAMRKVLSLRIPVPPMAVQRKIVRTLDRFSEHIEELIKELSKELLARKQQYQYYLNDSFESQTDNLVSLESIGTLTRGKRFVHADATETGVPCIHYGELYTYYGVHADTVKSHIREDLRPKMRYAHKGDVIIVGAGENNIDIGIGVAWEGDEDVAVHDACYTFSHSQNSKYIAYYLRTDMYHNQIKKYVSEGKICSISASGLGKADIPIPSLEEQHRIVTMLEKFDAVCNEIITRIQKEMDLRVKQYEYYRDKLFTFGG